LMWKNDGVPLSGGEKEFFQRMESLTAKKWRETS
jgi:hypothetical protein